MNGDDSWRRMLDVVYVRGCLLAAMLVSFLSATAMGVMAATIVPTTEDRQAFETGVLQQQAINFFSDPRGCGMVLFRERCKAAFTALAGNLGKINGLDRFVATGNADAFDKKWSDANVVTFIDAPWKDATRETWLRAAGAMYEAYYVPDWQAYTVEQIPVYRELVGYAPGASPYDALLDAADAKAGPDAIDAVPPLRRCSSRRYSFSRRAAGRSWKSSQLVSAIQRWDGSLVPPPIRSNGKRRLPRTKLRRLPF